MLLSGRESEIRRARTGIAAAASLRPTGGAGHRGARARTQQRRGAGLGRGEDDAWM
jgi:hypothetical protein